MCVSPAVSSDRAGVWLFITTDSPTLNRSFSRSPQLQFVLLFLSQKSARLNLIWVFFLSVFLSITNFLFNMHVYGTKTQRSIFSVTWRDCLSSPPVCSCRMTGGGSRWRRTPSTQMSSLWTDLKMLRVERLWGAALWNIWPTTATCCPCSPAQDSCDIISDITKLTKLFDHVKCV